jgi:hypothetical protein
MIVVLPFLELFLFQKWTPHDRSFPICRDSYDTNEISSLQVPDDASVDDVIDAIITTQQIYYFQTTPLIKPT